MATDQYSVGKLGLIEPGRGNYVDTWDAPLFANWQTLDAAVSGTTTITLSNQNVVLTIPTYPTYPNPPTTANSAQNLRLLLNGTLSANVTVSVPAGVGGFWIVDNQTTGPFSVSIKTTSVGSAGVFALQGYRSLLFSDGANINFADSGGVISNTPQLPSGTVLPYAGPVVPSGYLFCDGSQYATSLYPNLFAAIGYTWGGSGLVFNVPNYQNQFLRGASSTVPVGTYEANSLASHTHTAAVTDPGHQHTIDNVYSSNFKQNNPYYTPTSWGTGTVTSNAATTGISVSIGATGSTETRPNNFRVMFMIKV